MEKLKRYINKIMCISIANSHNLFNIVPNNFYDYKQLLYVQTILLEHNLNFFCYVYIFWSFT